MRYLYFDDEPPDAVKSFIDAITKIHDRNFEVTIDHYSPKPWDEMDQFLKEEKYDGVILDLRLDKMVMWDRKTKLRAQYRAQEIAQKIRVEASDGILADIPIVLWSTDQNLNHSGFSRDSTPKDLFDLKIIKTKIIEDPVIIRLKLYALSKGYRQIEKFYEGNEINIAKCLALGEDISFMDPRVFSYFDVNFKPTIHDIARFILDQIIRFPGPFISDNLLATRLGVSIEDSPDWINFSENVLSHIRYRGIFSEGWKVYNMQSLLNWWTEVSPSDKYLRKLSSHRRVEILNKNFSEFSLSAIPINEDAYKGQFWYNCIATGAPVSQNNSFIVSTPHKLPWQENRYISFRAILSREDRTQGIRIDELDRSRFEKFKKDRS